MERRKFLLGMGSAAAGGSALLGSGAFSRVESQRDVTIQVAEDPNAYLGMKPLDTPNSKNYVRLDPQGHLKIDIGDGGLRPGHESQNPIHGSGVNSDSFTFFDGMFELCNQGKKDACISYELPPAPDARAYGDDFIAPDPDYDEQVVTFYYISEGGDDPAPEGDRIFVQEGETVPLPLGECKEIGVRTVTKGVDATLEEPLTDGDVTITADVDGDCFGGSDTDPEDTVDLSLQPAETAVPPKTTQTYDLVVEGAKSGIGSYETTITIGDTSVAEIVDAEAFQTSLFQTTIADDGSSVQFRGLVQFDAAPQLTLAEIDVAAADTTGETSLDLTVDEINDPDGSPYTVDSATGATLTVVES